MNIDGKSDILVPMVIGLIIAAIMVGSLCILAALV